MIACLSKDLKACQEELKESSMNIKNIKNISDESIQLNVGNGANLTLDPGASFQNVKVDNLDQIKEKVKVTSDLGEIRETPSTKSKLYG